MTDSKSDSRQEKPAARPQNRTDHSDDRTPAERGREAAQLLIAAREPALDIETREAALREARRLNRETTPRQSGGGAR